MYLIQEVEDKKNYMYLIQEVEDKKNYMYLCNTVSKVTNCNSGMDRMYT